MRFDLTDLRLFLAVVEAGSITHGATAANLSLAAASERLRDMEAVGGVSLLDRGRRGVTPTRAGEALAHHARLILGQIARMQGDLGEHALGLRATVRLLANTAAMTEFLPDPLGVWLAAHPRIDVDLRERQSSEIVKAIAGGLADIGIISDAVDSGGLTLRPFAIDRLVVVMARAHPLAGTKRIAFADIVDQAHVGLAAGALQDHVEQQAENVGHKLKVRARVRTFDGLCRMAAHGVGVAVMPETAARRSSRSMSIAIARLTDDWATRRLSVCCRSEPELPAPARDLMAHLAETGVRG
ncbi:MULTISPECIES: LysR substrate-binding domain-containing protein [Sphingomonadales]|uniref:Transcriptional regulator n=2 Tax=Sphingomonadales TaxID=204457 RepID=A0A0A7PLT6_9SPHN|nr:MULTISPECIES: LysR substrate-binding domain-containing protein [Sphingomonadaceae]AJA10970.1 transcriptional regulator [Sphingopyxis fribergensis]OHT17709.1 HTH-type transcriptional regulator CysL [Sphingomonas haloaromaticamans]